MRAQNKIPSFHPIGNDPAEAFRAEMEGAGLHTPDPIVADGALHRIHLEGDRKGTRNGWYRFHSDPPVSGAFGCWRRGVSCTWSATERERLTVAERELIHRRAEDTRRARQLEEQRQHEQARGRARVIWDRSRPADPLHPYLRRKEVAPGTARQYGERLVLPVVDLDARLWSLQFIDPAGGKMLLKGGRKRGNVIPVSGSPLDAARRVLVCEGWATGSTLAEIEPEALVLAAIDAGNLEPVAVALRARRPHAEIVICCDSDPVGIAKGRAAAIAAGAEVAVPEFPEGAEGTDFNDLAALLRGVAA